MLLIFRCIADLQGHEYLQVEIITSHHYEGIGGQRVEDHQLASSRTHSWPVKVVINSSMRDL